MNRNVKIALCTLALITCGFATKSTTSVYAAEATKNVGIAAPENGIVTQEYVKKIVDAGVSIQSVLDKYMDQIVTIGNNAFVNCKESLDFSKANNLKVVYYGAFYNSNLKAINLENVESLGTAAFSHCESLTDVHFGNNVELKDIPQEAFVGCYGLESIKIPESVEEIGPSAFANSGLRYVVLPKEVKLVDKYAFAGCPDMIYARAENPNIEFRDSYISNCFFKEHISIYWKSEQNIHPKESDLKYIPVILFCNREDLDENFIYPLSEMDNFKLLTITKDGKYITLDANAKHEPVSNPFVQDHNGTIVIGTGYSHVYLPTIHVGDVKTIVIADGVKRISDLPYSESKYDVVIPNSVIDKIYFSGDVKTVYTNNEKVIKDIQESNKYNKEYGRDIIEIKPLGGEQYMMLTDDAEIHELWNELAKLRAKNRDHLALDDASKFFDDSEFFNSSLTAHDKLVARREMKNKLKELLEKAEE